jgi:hypothetical protein
MLSSDYNRRSGKTVMTESELAAKLLTDAADLAYVAAASYRAGSHSTS